MAKIVFYHLRARAREHPYFWPEMPLQMCAMSRWKGSRLVRFENRPETSSRRIKSILEKKIGGMGYLSSPLEPLEIAKNSVFWARLKASRGERKHPTPQFFFSMILFNLLQHVFGRFSNPTTLETFHLDIAHIYRGISGQKQGCSRARARRWQNTIFAIFHLYGSYLGYHNMKHMCAFKKVSNHPPLLHIQHECCQNQSVRLISDLHD